MNFKQGSHPDAHHSLSFDVFHERKWDSLPQTYVMECTWETDSAEYILKGNHNSQSTKGPVSIIYQLADALSLFIIY